VRPNSNVGSRQRLVPNAGFARYAQDEVGAFGRPLLEPLAEEDEAPKQVSSAAATTSADTNASVASANTKTNRIWGGGSDEVGWEEGVDDGGDSGAGASLGFAFDSIEAEFRKWEQTHPH
jgi:hypothetical protein